MDVTLFNNSTSGTLVEISGSDPVRGPWRHHAFRPRPLDDAPPELSSPTYLAVANARASLAALDSTAQRLPDPTLLRMPTVRREAQATSALEGTYAPLVDVLALEDEAPEGTDLREVHNYVTMAAHAFDLVGEGRPLSVPVLEDLQHMLLRGTRAEATTTGHVRESQVVIGRRPDAPPGAAPIHAARFIPPPGDETLRADVRELLTWVGSDHSASIDPVVATALAHYQFETLHPFHDGNGRLGRLLVVLHLQSTGVLREPTLTISPWFEARRAEYYDRLMSVSTDGDVDGFVGFFAQGLHESAAATHRHMLALVTVQDELKDVVRASPLRAESALALVDVAVGYPFFTVKRAATELGVSIGRANGLVGQLSDLGVLAQWGTDTYKRRFHAPRITDILLGGL